MVMAFSLRNVLMLSLTLTAKLALGVLVTYNKTHLHYTTNTNLMIINVTENKEEPKSGSLGECKKKVLV